MKNFKQQGEAFGFVAPYARTAGQGVQVGAALFGICTNDVANGASGVAKRGSGVYTLDKTSAQAWAIGDKLYWDNTNKVVTSVSTSNLYIGVAFAVAANPSATGDVLLHGAVT